MENEDRIGGRILATSRNDQEVKLYLSSGLEFGILEDAVPAPDKNRLGVLVDSSDEIESRVGFGQLEQPGADFCLVVGGYGSRRQHP